MSSEEALLASVRVLEVSGGPGDAVGRILADLGADVLKVEPPGGGAARTALPSLAGTSIAFAVHNANKRSTMLDPSSPADRERFLALAGAADIVIDSGRPGRAVAYGTSGAALARRFGHLVCLSVTDFGATGPRASWRATDAVLYALSSALSRSGPPRGTPVLPPDGMASATAAAQATWATLVAYYRRLRCGRGDYIDFSRFEAVTLGLDPPFGSHGQAAAARGAEPWRGRPENQDAYPIIACADGYVRLVVMAPRQWRGLRAWMGEPPRYQDPKYDGIAERFNAWDDIGALLAGQFAGRTRDDLVATGQSYGVPIAAVLEPDEVVAAQHFRSVGAFTDAELIPGVRLDIPAGYFTVDGRRAGYRTPAPAAGADPPAWSGPPAPTRAPTAGLADPPLAGLRILDFGVIVAGGELGRLFADLGAEVIKVESATYPDGLRQGRPGQLISESFAWTHRNKLGLGLELRAPGGAEVFAELVARSDAVFANFKPGTLAGLGFSYDRLREINPRIVLAESSAFGDTGPWSARLGYGPLVRASTGVTSLWTDANNGPGQSGRHPFFDATTVFPDHVVGRITAIAALAALIRRDRTGAGARVHVSQAEAGINQLDTVFVTRAVLADHPRLLAADPAVSAVLPSRGADEWCVISADPAVADAVLGTPNWPDWTGDRTPVEAAETLQAAGVAAAPMSRRADVLRDPQVLARALYQPMTHPLIDGELPAESGPAKFDGIDAVPQRPAPLAGQDTVRICRDVLRFDEARIAALVADGVLFTATEPARIT